MLVLFFELSNLFGIRVMAFGRTKAMFIYMYVMLYICFNCGITLIYYCLGICACVISNRANKQATSYFSF